MNYDKNIHQTKYPNGIEELDIARLMSNDSEGYEAYLIHEKRGLGFIWFLIKFIVISLLLDVLAFISIYYVIGISKKVMLLALVINGLVSWYYLDMMTISKGTSKYINSKIENKNSSLEKLFK